MPASELEAETHTPICHLKIWGPFEVVVTKPLVIWINFSVIESIPTASDCEVSFFLSFSSPIQQVVSIIGFIEALFFGHSHDSPPLDSLADGGQPEGKGARGARDDAVRHRNAVCVGSPADEIRGVTAHGSREWSPNDGKGTMQQQKSVGHRKKSRETPIFTTFLVEGGGAPPQWRNGVRGRQMECFLVDRMIGHRGRRCVRPLQKLWAVPRRKTICTF